MTNMDSDNAAGQCTSTQVGRLVDRALGDWGRTGRLCVIGLTGVVLWGGCRVIEHSVTDQATSTCVTVTDGGNSRAPITTIP